MLPPSFLFILVFILLHSFLLSRYCILFSSSLSRFHLIYFPLSSPVLPHFSLFFLSFTRPSYLLSSFSFLFLLSSFLFHFLLIFLFFFLNLFLFFFFSPLLSYFLSSFFPFSFLLVYLFPCHWSPISFLFVFHLSSPCQLYFLFLFLFFPVFFPSSFPLISYIPFHLFFDLLFIFFLFPSSFLLLPFSYPFSFSPWRPFLNGQWLDDEFPNGRAHISGNLTLV